MYVYIYIYIERERQKKREREREIDVVHYEYMALAKNTSVLCEAICHIFVEPQHLHREPQ